MKSGCGWRGDAQYRADIRKPGAVRSLTRAEMATLEHTVNLARYLSGELRQRAPKPFQSGLPAVKVRFGPKRY
jgi:hypothetical protein